MKVSRHSDAGSFLSAVEDFLCLNEAENNLIIGISRLLKKEPDRYGTPPYFATVEDGSTVVAAALRTPPHNLLVAGAMESALGMVLADAMEADASIPGVYGPKASSRVVAEAWKARTGGTIRLTSEDRVHQLDRVTFPPPAPGRLRLAVEQDARLISEWMTVFKGETGAVMDTSEEKTRKAISRGRGYLWEDGKPKAMVIWGRETKNSACISGVFTPAANRNRGYASNAVAALSQKLLDDGWKFTVLFTQLSNPVSNSIYAKIGYRPVSDFDTWKFEAGEKGNKGG